MRRAFELSHRVLLALATAFVVVAMLVLVARPIATEDFWWHLKMGEVISQVGPLPAVDPLLHTTTRAPMPHEWLFSWSAWAVTQVAGFAGVRVVHTVLAMGALALVFRLARRQSRSTALAALALTIFAVLALPRLAQARPDLITIAATLGLFALTWGAERRVSARAMAATALLFLVWVNMHSLFLLGLVLLAAGAVGARLHEGAARQLGGAIEVRSTSLGKSLALSALATVVNPRGLHQHLTFFSVSGGSALWSIEDEWTPLDPFRLGMPFNSTQVHPLSLLTIDALMVLFAAAFVALYRRHRRAPTAQTLDDLGPATFLPAAAALGSVFVSSRFLWLAGALVGLWLARAAGRLRVLETIAGRASLSVGGATLAALLPGATGFAQFMGDTPAPPAYFNQGYNEARYPDPGVQFLAQSGVEGRLFNHYTLGGYLGYRLAPTLRTFVDGRTEHYTAALSHDYHRIIDNASGTRLELLDFYGIDVFFAFGGEASHYPSRTDTLRALKGVPGWKLVFRGVDHAVYLRDLPRNEKNFDRVAAWYRAQGVPFSGEFDVAAVLEQAEPWAVQRHLVPAEYPALVQAALDAQALDHAAAVRRLAQLYRVLDDTQHLRWLRTVAK